MSAIFQVDEPIVLRDHVERIRAIERSGALWIVVGTIGVDGVDSLITPDSPPFLNGWTHALGLTDPVQFCIVNGWVHLLGGFLGGSDGSVVFNLPVGFRPTNRIGPVVIGTSATNHYATYYVEPTGDIVFGTIV